MDNILDHVVVQGQRYDIVSPTAFGDYIETIGSACINPDGYAQGSTFLAKLGNEQFYYEATAAITQGSTISEGTNCKKTTVAGREAELAAEIDSVNEAFTNQSLANGAVNMLPIDFTSQVINGVTFTVNSDKTITVSGTATDTIDVLLHRFESWETMPLKKMTGCPSGGSTSTYYLRWIRSGAFDRKDTGDGAVLDAANTAAVEVRLIILSGVSVSNIVFKPMISFAMLGLNYNDYVPYAMTNRELTDNLSKASISTSTRVEITTSDYNTPVDGYISVYAPYTDDYCRVDVNGLLFVRAANSQCLSCYVKAGTNMRLNSKSSNSSAFFYPVA